MRVYDVDKTLYDGDSTLDFYHFCLRRQPSLVRYWPAQFFGLMAYVFGRRDKTQWKASFFIFLKGIRNLEDTLRLFWDAHLDKVALWYLAQKSPQDVWISASPTFLLKPLANRLGVHRLIASEVDPATGRFLSPNCHGPEKVRRFEAIYGQWPIQVFYSDHLSDAPLARKAKKAYLVKDHQRLPWNSPQAQPKQSVLRHFYDRRFLAFLLIGGLNAFNGIFFALVYDFWLPANAAFILGYGTSLSISYVLNSRFNFLKKMTWRAYGRFWLSYLPNFLIQNLVVLLIYNLLQGPKLLAYVLAVLLGLPITFLMMKFYAFGQDKSHRV